MSKRTVEPMLEVVFDLLESECKARDAMQWQSSMPRTKATTRIEILLKVLKRSMRVTPKNVGRLNVIREETLAIEVNFFLVNLRPPE